MLYKEWRVVRIKFVIWALIYLGAIGLFLYEHSLAFSPYNEPLFQSWEGISAIIMTVIAALGGVDIVSEERANGTLSYLLTKPVSRASIYTSKISLNVAALAAVTVPANLLVLAIDQANPSLVKQVQFITEACGDGAWCSGWKDMGIVYRSVDIQQSVGALGLILLYGVGIICLSGLISIFARNTIQAIFFTIPALIAFIVIASVTLMAQETFPGLVGPILSYRVNVLTVVLFLGMSAIFFYIGLLVFKRKEF